MRRILDLSGWLAEFETQGIKLAFIDAPHVVRPIPQLFGSLTAAGEYGRESYFGWGLLAGDTKDEQNLAAAVHGQELSAEEEVSRAAAVSESVRHVERWIEQHAPVSGICGISDGALIAAAVAARSQSLNVFINFCSMPWERLPLGMDLEVPQLITTPSLHLLGRADPFLSTAQLRSVPSRCENMTTLWHDGGHVVPLLDNGMKAALRRFLFVGANFLPQGATPPVLPNKQN